MTSFIASHGVYAVFILMFVDAIFPAASELVMVVGGALAAAVFSHRVTLFGYDLASGVEAYLAVALAGTIGYLLGSILGWWIGDRGGRPFLERHGRWFHLTPERLSQAERWFARWGDWAVLLGRITPVVRSFVSIPAGVFRMPLGRYVVLTAIGSAIWAFALAGVGWGLGRSYATFHHDFRYVEYAILAGIVAAVVYLVRRWRRSTTLARRAEDSAH